MKINSPRARWAWLAGIALILVLACPVRAGTLLIAAAADLVFCLDDLGAAFTRRHPEHTFKITTGSSGNFFAQIRNGAPYDLFLSADVRYPQELINAGLAERTSLTRYGVGRIVLWTLSTNFDSGRGLDWLRSETVRRVAIANPEHAPYGRAARAALEHANLWEVVRPKLVLGENISQTAQFVQTGNADAGIVALSLVLAPKLAGQGRYYEIPGEWHPVLEQGAVLTKRGAQNAAAVSYLQFLTAPEARGIFARYGFRLPAKTE